MPVLPSGAMSTLPNSAKADDLAAPLPSSTATGAISTTSTVRFAALQSPNFRLLWFGLLISNAGTWMESTASGWLVTDLEPSHASFWLGLIAISFAIPMLLLPPFGGAIADRFPRMRMLWIVQILYLVLSSTLAIVVLSGAVRLWMLIAYAFVNGIVLAFDSPTRHSLLPDILSREQLASGVSLNSVAFTGAGLIGPALAGVLIPIIGVGGVMTVNACSCVATLYALFRMTDVPSRHHLDQAAASILSSIGHAVTYVRSSPMLTGLIALSAVGGLTGRSYGPLLAVFARDEYHVGSTAYGAMVSVGGLGTLVGAFGLAGRKEVGRKGLLIACACIAQGVLLLAFAISPWFALSLPFLAGIGVVNALSGASISTLIQLTAPAELRGRVMSLYLLTVVGFPSVGSFIFGSIAEPVGVRGAVGLAAVVFLAASGVLLMRNASIRRAV